MKEIEVGAFEAKNRLSALVEEAAKGQRVCSVPLIAANESKGK